MLASISTLSSYGRLLLVHSRQMSRTSSILRKKRGREDCSLFLLRLLRTLLQDGTLRSGLLDLLDDFIPALGGLGEFVFDLGLFVVDLLLLLSLNLLHLLLMFLVVGLDFLKLGVVLGGGTSHLGIELRFLRVDFFLGFFSLGLHALHDLLVVSLGLLLDDVEFLD